MILGIVSIIITIVLAENGENIINGFRSGNHFFILLSVLALYSAFSITYNLIFEALYYVHGYRRMAADKSDPDFKPLPDDIRNDALKSEMWVLFREDWGRKKVWQQLILGKFFAPKHYKGSFLVKWNVLLVFALAIILMFILANYDKVPGWLIDAGNFLR